MQHEPDTVGDTVILGVDTHKDFHVAVALDGLGRRLGVTSVPTTVDGYGRLVRWAQGLGTVGSVGVEGTGSFGAGVARFLKCKGFVVERQVHGRRLRLAHGLQVGLEVPGGVVAGVRVAQRAPYSSDGTDARYPRNRPTRAA